MGGPLLPSEHGASSFAIEHWKGEDKVVQVEEVAASRCQLPLPAPVLAYLLITGILRSAHKYPER